jgi:hypothetical protein
MAGKDGEGARGISCRSSTWRRDAHVADQLMRASWIFAHCCIPTRFVAPRRALRSRTDKATEVAIAAAAPKRVLAFGCLYPYRLDNI